jgi:oxygen-dependent protoporphyrinogen oxidase
VSESLRVIVVGAGVAGLATAWLIAERARQSERPLQLRVFESRSVAGGSTRTDQQDGFLCEWGPNGFLDNEPATLKLVEQLGLTDRLQRSSDASAHRFIFHGGRLREVPSSPPAFLKSDIVPLPAKLRMAGELFVARGPADDDESVYDFGCRRLGPEFANLLLDPMVTGIFAGDVRQLSLRAVFPKMAEMEQTYGGLFRALFAKTWHAKLGGTPTGGPGGPRGTLHTFRDGMGELTTTLADQLGDAVELEAAVRAVERQDDGFVVHTQHGLHPADAVVIACPSYAAASMVAGLSPNTARALDDIWHAPVDVVCFGFGAQDLRRPVDGFGVLIPRTEGIRTLGTLLSDRIFPGQAPEGQRLLRTLIGGAHDPSIGKLSLDDLEATVERDLDQLFGLDRPPCFRRSFRHAQGIAQYTIGHLDRVARTERLEEEHRGLYFTGASYRGVSVNGCIKDAFLVRDRLWEAVGG